MISAYEVPLSTHAFDSMARCVRVLIRSEWRPVSVTVPEVRERPAVVLIHEIVPCLPSVEIYFAYAKVDNPRRPLSLWGMRIRNFWQRTPVL